MTLSSIQVLGYYEIKMIRFSFVRDLEAQGLLDEFFISAVSSILLIRGYLQLTGYPQIGSGSLHIAHMLWGGLLMLLAIIGALVFLNREKYWLVAILGGIGFGTFIDELGKFVTRDNNYFFEPTVAIIYVLFILIYLVLKFIENYTKPSAEEYLVNCAEIIKQALVNKIPQEKFAKAQDYLSHLNQSDEVNRLVQNLLQRLQPHITDKSSNLALIKHKVVLLYDRFVSQNLFKWAVVAFFIIQAIYTSVHSVISTEIIADYILPNHTNEQTVAGSFDELGNVIFSTLSGIIIIIGIFVLFKSRLKSYQLFRIAILINIFLTQFFNFYNNQFEALYGFFFNVAVLITLNFMIDREKSFR